MRNIYKAFAGLFGAVILLSGATDYKIVARYPVPGTGRWDYVGIDSPARRVYILHATQVGVIDAHNGKTFGTISDTPGVHGGSISSGFKNGFSSNWPEN